MSWAERHPNDEAVCQAPSLSMPRRSAATSEIIRLKEAGVRPSEIAIMLGIGRASVYRVLGEQNGGGQEAV